MSDSLTELDVLQASSTLQLEQMAKQAIRERDEARTDLLVTRGEREALKGALAEARAERDDARRLVKATCEAADMQCEFLRSDSARRVDVERGRTRKLVEALHGLVREWDAHGTETGTGCCEAAVRRALAEYEVPQP